MTYLATLADSSLVPQDGLHLHAPLVTSASLLCCQFPSRLQNAAIQGALAETLRSGDVVMIKGSNGSRLGPVVAALKERFRGAPSAS